jgi:ATP adenylyltransferase
MPEPLLPRIDRTVARAVEAGALQPIRTERAVIRDAGIDFGVRWVSSLAHKDAARVQAAGRRTPDFNPFLPPEPALTVGPLGSAHLAVLNKYPVIARHLLIVTRAYEAQTAPLSPADFAALAQVMGALGGLGFYNGGTEGGASQHHKHLQWIPESAEGASLRAFTAALPADLPAERATSNPALPWRHVFVRLRAPSAASPETAGAALQRAFHVACDALGIAAAADPMPAYNLLVWGDWLAVIPRRCEHSRGISVNALGFAGSLFVRRPELIETVRASGPLRLLAAVAFAR